MSAGYWLWRFCKTFVCIAVYYLLLFASGVAFYPQGIFNDLSRAEKMGMSMGISVIILFILCSLLVIVNRLIRKKTWFSPFSVGFSYFLFGCSHFIFMAAMSRFMNVDFKIHIIIFCIFFLVSILSGLLRIKREDCLDYWYEPMEEEIDDE